MGASLGQDYTRCRLIEKHKTIGPSLSVVFLGIEIDSNSMTLRLPEEKLMELKALILGWLGKKVMVARDLRSLVGKLEHACRVICPGMRRMLDLLSGVKSNHRHIRLSASFHSDLMWWHLFLSSWNGVLMVQLETWMQPDVVVHSDASGSLDCAAWWSEGWFLYEWPPKLSQNTIPPKETCWLARCGIECGRTKRY